MNGERKRVLVGAARLSFVAEVVRTTGVDLGVILTRSANQIVDRLEHVFEDFEVTVEGPTAEDTLEFWVSVPADTVVPPNLERLAVGQLDG